MTGVSPFTEPVDPVIANASANRGKSVVASERLECARVVIAPLENYVALRVEDFAAPLSEAAEVDRLSRRVAHNDFLA